MEKKGINIKTATHIYKMLCRPILEYGLILLLNAKKHARKRIEVAETTCLKKITKICHPNNSLHNPPNTSITPILERSLKIRLKTHAMKKY